MPLASYFKALIAKDPRPNQEIAQKIGMSPSNLSKILNGDNDNPAWLTIVSLTKELGGSLDEAADIVSEEKRDLASLVGAQRQRIDDQRAIIENQQRTFDFRVNDYEKRLADKDTVLAERQRILQKQLDDSVSTYRERLQMTKDVYEARLLEHKNQLQRERNRCDSLQSEIARIRKIDTFLSVALAIVAVVALYLIIDAFNGDWGFILY